MKGNPVHGGWLEPDPELEAEAATATDAVAHGVPRTGEGADDWEAELEALVPLWHASAPVTDEAALRRLRSVAADAIEAPGVQTRGVPAPPMARQATPRTAWRGRRVALAAGFAAALAAGLALALRPLPDDAATGARQDGEAKVALAVAHPAAAGAADVGVAPQVSAEEDVARAGAAATAAPGAGTAAAALAAVPVAGGASARDEGPNFAEAGQAFDLVASADFAMLDSLEDEGLLAGSLLASMDADGLMP